MSYANLYIHTDGIGVDLIAAVFDSRRYPVEMIICSKLNKNEVFLRNEENLLYDQRKTFSFDPSNNGRFKNLCYEKLWKSKNKVITEETDFFIGQHQFTLDPIIDWISENITNKWSFRVKSNLNRYTIRYEFLFENRIDAAYFSLRWR